MTGNEYQKLAARTMNGSLTRKETVLHALHGLAGEVGEIHSLYQKTYQGHTFDIKHELKELGDLLWFIAELCTVSGYELDQVMQLNIDKLKQRYPEGFSEDKSINRLEGDI